jgi:hypothetical protein
MVTTAQFTDAIEFLFTQAFASIDQEPTTIADLVVDDTTITVDLVLNQDGIPGANVFFTLAREVE